MQTGHPARDRGAAAVEFALVMPLLFLLIIGIIQYGYGFFQMQAAQATIREAARSAALGISTCDEWKAIVEDAAEGNGMAVDAIVSTPLEFQNDNGADAPPQRGDTLIASLTYRPSLDFSLVPYPNSIPRDARTTVEDIDPAFDDTSCAPGW